MFQISCLGSTKKAHLSDLDFFGSFYGPLLGPLLSFAATLTYYKVSIIAEV